MEITIEVIKFLLIYGGSAFLLGGGVGYMLHDYVGMKKNGGRRE